MIPSKKISVPLPNKFINILDQHIKLVNLTLPQGRIYSTRSQWCREAFQEKIEKELNLIKENDVENKSLIHDIEQVNNNLK